MSGKKPKFEALVVNAIRRLQAAQGSTANEIASYLSQEYDVAGPEIKKQIQLTIRRGVNYGILQRSKRGYITCDRNIPEPLEPLDVSDCYKCKRAARRGRQAGMKKGRGGRGRSARRTGKTKKKTRGRTRSRKATGKRRAPALAVSARVRQRKKERAGLGRRQVCRKQPNSQQAEKNKTKNQSNTENPNNNSNNNNNTPRQTEPPTNRARSARSPMRGNHDSQGS